MTIDDAQKYVVSEGQRTVAELAVLRWSAIHGEDALEEFGAGRLARARKLLAELEPESDDNIPTDDT